MKPLVSVIVPCRNERRYIAACIGSILRGDYPREQLEMIVVDGCSDDGTREVLSEIAAANPAVRVLDNPAGITPVALNLGIAAARGRVIMRMDGHNEYPANYISSLVHWLEQSGADNVGGVCVTMPGDRTAMAEAIACALSHPLGVGNAYFRIGVREPRWVDTVPFGCYRREVFERIGVFDEELVRNQDDELNHRLIAGGGRILLVPGIESRYYARETLAKVWRMYWQYGYFKPLAAAKTRGVRTWRQLVPAAFVFSLSTGALLLPFGPPLALLGPAVVVLYGAAVLSTSVVAMRRIGWKAALLLPIVFPAIHLAYGSGYLKGAVRWLFRRGATLAQPGAVPITR